MNKEQEKIILKQMNKALEQVRRNQEKRIVPGWKMNQPYDV
jgi:hypothetical protein